MRTLDRYITRQFLVNYLILLAVFMMLFMLIDLIVDLDEFVEAGKRRADDLGGALPATVLSILDYYGPVLVLLYVFFSGLLTAAALGFTVMALGRTGELAAMATSGQSMMRSTAPVVVAGCLLSLLTLPCQELVIPNLAHKLARSKAQVRQETIGSFPVHYAVDRDGQLLSASQFTPGGSEPLLTGVTILRRDAEGRVFQRITAEQGFWDDDRGGWELVGGMAIHAGQEDLGPAGQEQRPVDTVEFFLTTLSPSVLLARRATIFPMLLSSMQLNDLAKDMAPHNTRIRQIMHSRFSLLIVNMIVLLIGLPFFLVVDVGNPMAQGVKAAAACMAAWGGALVLLQLPVDRVNPLAMAWLPVVLLMPTSVVLLRRIRS